MAYTIGLCSVWWEPGAKDIRAFNSITERNSYFDNLIANRKMTVEAFPFNDNVNTVVNFTVPVNFVEEQFNNFNYVVVYNNLGPSNRRYYFARIHQLSGNNLNLDLYCDVYTTYYLECRENMGEGMVHRGFVNRFTLPYGETELTFDNTTTSILLENENINLNKYISEVHPLIFGPKDNIAYKNFVENSGLSWVLVFAKQQAEDLSIKTLQIDGVNTNYQVFVAPIVSNPNYKTVCKYHYTDGTGEKTTTFDWDFNALNRYLHVENRIADVLNMKITPIMPFDTNNLHLDFSESKTMQIELGISGLEEPLAVNEFKDLLSGYVISIPNQRSFENYCEKECEITFNNALISNTRSKSQVIADENTYVSNPKILSQNFQELVIMDYAGNSYSIDFQKLNLKQNKITLYIKEPLIPDITKGYIYAKIQIDNFGVFQEGFEDSYIGLVYSNDTSIPYAVSQLETFLANNKNYALMQQAQRDYNTDMTRLGQSVAGAKGLIGIGGKLLSGDIFGGLASAAGLGFEQYAAGERTRAANELSLLNENLTIDNMRAAPPDLKNAQGSVFFNFLVQTNKNFNFKLMIRQGIWQEIGKANDYMVANGFTIERLGKITDYDRVMTNFNYVEFEATTFINEAGAMPNEVKQALRNILRACRMWYTDDISYKTPNYERGLNA